MSLSFVGLSICLVTCQVGPGQDFSPPDPSARSLGAVHATYTVTCRGSQVGVWVGGARADCDISDTQGGSVLPSPSRFPGNQSQENSTR